jgi:hypothetical protein
MTAPLHDTGQLIEGKGVYIGPWEPKDQKGGSLGKVFDIYAAPEDLKDENGLVLKTFEKTAFQLPAVFNFHGHCGTSALLQDERYILGAARSDPAALEEWFIPTKEILGTAADGDDTAPATLYNSREKGALKGTFEGTYWSCTEWADPEEPDALFYVHSVDFTGQKDTVEYKNYLAHPTRLVRAELRP